MGEYSAERTADDLAFTPKEQVSAMVGADIVSIAYIFATSYALDGSQYRPGLVFLAVSLLAWSVAMSPYLIPVILWEVGIFSSKVIENNSGRKRASAPQQLEPYDIPRWVSPVVVIGFAVFMIVQLGLVTQYTGGTLESPYAQLLIAAALLAPYVANSWKPALAMWVLSISSFVVFGFLRTPIYLEPPEFPGALVVATVVLTSLVAVAVAVAIKQAQRDRITEDEAQA